MIKTNVCLNMEDFEQCQESILSWNTTDPRFQECIEKSVIPWTPCVLLLLGAPLHVLTLNNDTKPVVLKNIQRVVTLCITAIALCYIGLIMMNIVNGDVVPTPVVLSPIIILISLVMTLYNDSRRPLQGTIKTNTFLNITWILLFFALILRLYLHDSPHGSFFKNGITDILNFTTLCLYFVLVLCRVIESAFAETFIENEKDFQDQTSPESKASLLSLITFNWIGPLILKKQYIERKDLWPLRKGNTASSITQHFEKYWNQQLDYTQRIKPEAKLKREEQTNKTQQGNLCICLLKTYGPILFLSTIYKLMFHAADFMYPIVLRALILLATDKSGDNSYGYLYSFLLLCAILGKSIFGSNHQQKTHEAMMRSWTALTIAIYKKTLKLSSSAKKFTTVGEITNLMSSDANKIGECMWSISDVMTHPLVFCISFYYLWQILGPSILVGIVIMILLIPLNLKLMKKFKALHLKHSSLRDSRIKMMNEVLNGIQAIKMYAWEKSFEKQISDIRNKELGVKKENMRTGAYMWTAFNISPFMISLGTFATYVLLDPNNVLTADKAFVSMSYFHMINWSMTVLPNCITNFVQANVSLKRIQTYLNSEELEEEFISRNGDNKGGVIMENGTFTWDRTTEATIKEININIPEGSLVAVVGSVGSGKSSLLSALLGEMECVTGQVNIKGSVAYVAQQPWIVNETLQKNILFGEDLIQKKYDRIIDSTALCNDLEILPGGDRTEIGEKGINLSGGQKQRVSLARAIYQDADVYLLDDPLSAVDSHVGKHIFDDVIGPSGLLKNKTRILVTHGISFLPKVDKIITVIEGRIGEIGSFKELLGRNGAFAEFLKCYLIDELKCEKSEEEIKALVMTEEFVSRINNDDNSETLNQHISEKSDKSTIKSQLSKTKSLTTESSSERVEIDKTKTSKGNRLIQDETVEVGKVKFEVFVTYAKAVGLQATLLIVVFIIINKLVQLSSDVWLSKWTNDNAIIANQTNKDELTHMRLGIYALHGLFQGVAVFGSDCVLHIAIYNTASRLHLDMLKNILRSPMSFFETTPVGRILNRFTKDIQTVDDVLLQNFRNAIQFVIFAVFNVLVVCAGSPRSVFPIVLILIFYIYIQRLFVKVSRQLRRLESAARSPIFSHFHETISGTSTIRAYQQQNRFISEISHRCDEVNTCHHILITSERWLNLRLSSLGGLVVFCASLFAISNMDDISPGQIGLTMMYAQSIVGILHRLVYMTNEAENNTVAVERIKEYIETPTEAQWVIQEKKPKKRWPSEGCVEFRDYGVRYREGLDLVLKGITCTINQREKIGIVGRTGAGKSSLTRGLFRIIEPAAGSVIVDGIDISTIGLHDLRSNITIIPQDPVLFSGTIRMNLDPFEEFPKEELWQALEHAHLKTFVSGLDGGLNYRCSEGGENLSVGQRQLVCLARALLRKTKILVLDEATAAVDIETDELIQNTIRREFDDCTILTIAHRLNTIIDYTRILVLDAGVIKEFDTPINLLKDTTSVFYGMAKDAGLHIP